MIRAPLPENERERLAALRAYEILDTPAEAAFDDLTRVAARICGTPVALVSLIDSDRQWFKSKVGLDAAETPRDLAFCSHAILQPDDVLVVPDARKDSRFSDNPLVVRDPNVIFYAGAPLVTPDGLPMGTLCVIDNTPRVIDTESLDTLRSLARATVAQLELRRTCTELRLTSGALSDTNRDLEKRNQEIRRFYQTLSHELKTPLTIIRDYVSMVMEGIVGEIGTEQRDFLTIGLEGCDQMTTHINDLLDLTRIETGKMRVLLRPMDLDHLVHSAVKGLVPLAARESIALASRSEADLPRIEADADRIVQVINNLVRNAIKFTPEHGRIDVETRRAPGAAGFVEIEVRDTGRGIAKRDLDQIFDRLYQCKEEDSASAKGLGIGLHLCREITRLHDGRILVESTEGAGTTFRIRLPIERSVGTGQDAALQTTE